MTRRPAAALALAGLWLVAVPAPAAAHGIGGRLDLPVPIWLFVYGAAAVVVVSFVALGVLWKQPRLEESRAGRALPGPLQRLLRSTIAEVVVRAVSLLIFALVFAAALAGEAFAVYFGLLSRIAPLAGVALAHDRALAAFTPKVAVRTQYALLGVMVLFTMSGLLILSGG